MKTTFRHEIDLPNGTVAKRSSESRRYSHGIQVIATRPDGTQVQYIESWSSTQALAMRAADSIRNRLAGYAASEYGRTHFGTLVSVQVVPVSRFDEHVTAGKKAAPLTMAKRNLTKGANYLVLNLANWAKPGSPDWTIDWAADQAKRVAHDARIVLGATDAN